MILAKQLFATPAPPSELAPGLDPSVERVIVVPFVSDEPSLDGLKQAVSWDDLAARDSLVRAAAFIKEKLRP